MIFCLTSPGHISMAQTPRFISRFIDNMKTNYNMENYVWVRELTKRGYPHFHFIAHWNKPQWFFDCSACGAMMKDKECTECYCTTSRINKLSLYWSSLFGENSVNSIRLGSYHPKTKKRSYYVTHRKQCSYLGKYIGKNIGESLDYLAEAGFPQTKYRKTVRTFGMSSDVAMFSEPQLFESQMYRTDSRTVMKADGTLVEIPTMNRTFISECGQLDEDDLKRYNWKWTGHGQTFIGWEKSLQKIHGPTLK